MGFFDNLGRSVHSTGRTTIQKTKELADIAKLNTQIGNNKSRMNQLYTEIGQKYCELHRSNPEVQLATLVNAIIEMEAQNKVWADQIQDLHGMTKCPHCKRVISKNTIFCNGCGQRVLSDDVTLCPNCGTVSQKGMLFCSKCGNRIPDEIPLSTAIEPKRNCEKCGAALDSETLFCSCCGYKTAQSPVDISSLSTDATETSADTAYNPPRICTTCGQPLQDGSDFCSNCGTPFTLESDADKTASAISTTYTCPSCGNAMEENERFCSNCGYNRS